MYRRKKYEEEVFLFACSVFDMGSDDPVITVPVYKGKLVDIRDEKMLQKALRADKVVGKFYRNYIKSDMSDIDRLLAVLKYFRKMSWNKPSSENDYKSLAKCKSGCADCQAYINSKDVFGFPNYAPGIYARTSHAELYSNMSYRDDRHQAFELLCVASGLKAFIRSYDLRSAVKCQSIKINIDGIGLIWIHLRLKVHLLENRGIFILCIGQKIVKLV